MHLIVHRPRSAVVELVTVVCQGYRIVCPSVVHVCVILTKWCKVLVEVTSRDIFHSVQDS